MNFIGEYQLFKRDGTVVMSKLYFEKGNLRATGKIYKLYYDSTIIGKMTTFINSFREEYYNTIPDQIGKWVEIETLYNLTNNDGKDKIKGIGTLLVKQAIKDSHDSGLNGYVQVNAVDKSHLFYYNLGFRPRPDLDKKDYGLRLNRIYKKLKNNEMLNNQDLLTYQNHLEEIITEKKLDPDVLTLDDIFITTHSEEMEILYQYYKITGKYINSYGSIIMYLPQK